MLVSYWILDDDQTHSRFSSKVVWGCSAQGKKQDTYQKSLAVSPWGHLQEG